MKERKISRKSNFAFLLSYSRHVPVMETAKEFSMDREVLGEVKEKNIGFGYNGYNERTRISGYRHTGQTVLWWFLSKCAG